MRTVTVTAATDYILLAPNNYFVTSKGTSSSNVEFGGDMDHAAALASHSAADLSEPDIGRLRSATLPRSKAARASWAGAPTPRATTSRSAPRAGMGAMWYNQNLYLGGSTNYCTSTPDINSRVGCFFESGMRAYFTLEYSGTGDGLIFALINGQLNQLASAGGDFEATELLGYAGDSRTNNSGGFLDTTGLKGLRPPKMGLEFDAKRNWDATFEAKPTDFCSGSSLRQNTRNDPDPASATKDFVQYVYWGNTSASTCPAGRPRATARPPTTTTATTPAGRPPATGSCRFPAWSTPPPPSARTARRFTSRPTTATPTPPSEGYTPSTWTPRATPLAGSGTPFFVGSNGVTSPVLDSSGNIYVGAGNALYVLRPNRTLKFSIYASARQPGLQAGHRPGRHHIRFGLRRR